MLANLKGSQTYLGNDMDMASRRYVGKIPIMKHFPKPYYQI